jgi:hypothetical protein
VTIYLVNYDPDGDDIAVVIDGKPKTLGPKKTETIPDDGDVIIRVSKFDKQTMVSVEHKSEVQHGAETI